MIDLSKLSPAELIRLAVEDMKKTVAQGITIDMGHFGKDIGKDTCGVCFAGCIMLQREKDNVLREYFDHSEGVATYFGLDPDLSDYEDQYYALDRVRVGNILDFCDHLGIQQPEKSHFSEDLLISKYSDFVFMPDGTFATILNFQKYEKGKEEQFYDQMEIIAQFFDDQSKRDLND